MKKVLVAVALLCMLPSVALGAGFAKQSLFLSKSSVVEGDTVLIHTVVSNDSTAKFTGSLVLEDEKVKVGTVPVTLEAGEADSLSLSWKPTAGTHTVTANLTDNSGTVVASESAEFIISEKPKPASQTPVTELPPVQSSYPIAKALTDFSPATGGVVTPFFSAIDSGREAAAGALEDGISFAKKQIAQAGEQGKVLGTQKEKSTSSGIFNSAWMMGATLLLYLLSVLRYIVGNIGFFYPIVAAFFLFLMWKLYRRYRRPAY